MESGPPLLLVRRPRTALNMRSGLNKTELKSGKAELRIEPGDKIGIRLLPITKNEQKVS